MMMPGHFLGKSDLDGMFQRPHGETSFEAGGRAQVGEG